MKSVLVLEDGTYFPGESFGKGGVVVGEVVFNTSMTGYQEIITDPSYCETIVTMTYPLIGSYGFNEYDEESSGSRVRGFVVKEICDAPSNWRHTIDPDEYFARNNVNGLKGIDTRALTRHIRERGSMFGIISTECGNIDLLLDRLQAEKLKKKDSVMNVAVKEPVHIPGTGRKLAILDFGVRNSVICSLKKRKCDIHILPSLSTMEEILSFEPDGILLSDGPGNPEKRWETVCTLKRLLDKKKPLLGIGLGHQLLGLALGGRVSKLKCGHHGANYPVRDLVTGRCFITTQNHNYVLDKEVGSDIMITQINLNDNTVEGFRHRQLPLTGVQYCIGELSGQAGCDLGLTDSSLIFDDFLREMGG